MDEPGIIYVSWDHFTRTADGPNAGPRLELASRLYRKLLSPPSWVDLFVVELPERQALEGYVKGFELESLRALVAHRARLISVPVSREEVMFLDELLARNFPRGLDSSDTGIDAPACRVCGTPMKEAGVVYVCEGCGEVVVAPH